MTEATGASGSDGSNRDEFNRDESDSDEKRRERKAEKKSDQPPKHYFSGIIYASRVLETAAGRKCDGRRVIFKKIREILPKINARSVTKYVAACRFKSEFYARLTYLCKRVKQ